MNAAKTVVTAMSTRPYLRRKAAAAIALTATGAAAAVFKYKARAMNNNDVEQRTRKAPNGYVSVDRSGGGV